jgi:hypothetical protein
VIIIFVVKIILSQVGWSVVLGEKNNFDRLPEQRNNQNENEEF